MEDSKTSSMQVLKANRKIAILLVTSILFMVSYIYFFLHSHNPKNFTSLKHYIIGFSAVISILSLFTFKNLRIRILFTLTSLAFLFWMSSITLNNHSSFFLLNVFILSPKLIQMWLFIALLLLSIYNIMWPYDRYRFLCVGIISLIFSFALALTILPKASLAFLQNSYQIAPVTEIANKQQKNGGYYSPLDAEYQYKLALYRLRKPDIITIGTSRVLGFHQFMFNVPFTNMGRTLGDLGEIKIFERLLAIHKPKIIIWGLDWWNFSQKTRYHWKYESDDGTHIIPSRLILPYQWIFNGKITLSQFIKTALGKKPNGVDNNSYGILARHHISGYAKDGSYLYFAELTALPNEEQMRFKNALKIIRKTNPNSIYFKQLNHIPKSKWDLLKKITTLLKKNHVELIVYLAPEPPAIVDAMKQSNRYHYIDVIRSQGHEHLSYFYDFFDPRVLESSNCEFQDSLHSGNIASMRILLALEKDKKNGLYNYINTNKLHHLIKKYQGRVDTPLPGMSENSETDFLGLGCKKGRGHAI